MPNGKLITNYQISEHAVKEALDSLTSPSIRLTSSHALCTLIMVDVFLANPDMPPIENSREFAVQKLLVDIIIHEYTVQRNIFHLPAPQTIQTQAHAISFIQEDALVDSIELMGWCILYFIYVRVNLNLSLSDFSEKAGLVSRTLRRYRANSIRRLRDVIIQEEWETRIKQRQLKLMAQFPEITPNHLFGRDNQFDQCISLIQRKYNANIQITGTEGIGKTAFIQEIIRRLWEMQSFEDIEYLIWIDKPTSIKDIRDAFDITIGFSNIIINIREFLLSYRTIIVIDDYDNLDPQSRNTLFDLFNPALIFLSNRETKIIQQADLHLQLFPLDYKDTSIFLRYLSQFNSKYDNFDLDTVTQWVFDAVGGNPQAIQMIVNSSMEWEKLQSIIPETLVKNTYHGLNVKQQKLCIYLTIITDKPIDLEFIIKLLPEWLQETDIYTLTRKSLAVIINSANSSTFQLHQIVRQYIINLIKNDQSLHELLVNILKNILQHKSHYPRITAQMSLCLLQLFPIFNQTFVRLLQDLDISDVDNRSIEWVYLIEYLMSDDDTKHDSYLNLIYGTILSRKGDFLQAESILNQLVQISGQKGKFILQIQAMIQLCTVKRFLGNYEEAEQLLEITQRYATRIKQDYLSSQIYLEQAQIKLDKGIGDEALDYLEKVDDKLQDIEWYIMVANAEFNKANYSTCVNIIKDLLNKTLSRHQLGRLYNLWGQIHIRQNDYRNASDNFTIAIEYLDDDTSVTKLSFLRAQSNLGATLMYMENLEESETLLHSVEREQRLFQDRIGLAITRHNLHLLEQSKNNSM